MDEKEIVQESLTEIFKQHGWDSSSSMTQRNFDHVSQQLHKKSKILISGITIKRLASGSFSRMPQIATLNAIANYFDFDTWEDYKASHVIDRSAKFKTDKNTSIRKGRKIALPATIAMAIIFLIATGFYLFSSPSAIRNAQKASFSAHKNTGNSIPNTVVFNYDLNQVEADSFFIQQSWDKRRKVGVKKGDSQLTDIYYEPGYHIAKLIANDSVIKTLPISIPTNGWFFYANENKAKYLTEYIKVKDSVKNGILGLTLDDLKRNSIQIEREKIYLYSFFPEKLSVNSGNFTLKSRVRMKEIAKNYCPYLMIEVYAQDDLLAIKSTPRGCANLGMLYLFGKKFSGRDTDLASTSYDITEWADLEVLVKNKHVTFKINGKVCFETDYQKPANLITGLSFISNGLCEVKAVQLKGLDGSIFYEDDFFAGKASKVRKN
jgi:hypothetical protein